MSEDHLSEIDSILAEELPNLEQDSDISISQRRQEELIKILRYAADRLGKSPTVREFNSMGLDVSADIIAHAFGTWNEAKEAAGLETGHRKTTRNINETYFKSIDSPEKAYWFGAVFATSSLQTQGKSGNYAIFLGRVEDKAHFVTGFADAVGSDYSIRWQTRDESGKQLVQTQISNPTFVEHLLNAGYPKPEDEQGEFPMIGDKFQSSFLRGYLESSGYFTVNGWEVTVSNKQRAEQLHDWFDQFGAKRPTVSQTSSRPPIVRVANPFDIKAVFETLWPELLETEPCWVPYPKKILQHLDSEYPYPENIPYLDGD